MNRYGTIRCVFLFCIVIAVTAGCAPRQKILPPQSGEMKALVSAGGKTAGLEESTGALPRTAKAGVLIDNAVVCTRVVDRVPQGAASSFDASVGKLCFYTVVVGAMRPITITHHWFWKDKEMLQVPVPVNSSRWRTFSSKKIDSGWIGPWTVKARDAGGRELASVHFTVEPRESTKR